ncbi:MutS-related protein [Janthinobacterium sp.]|uniref:MutS-related protein n=1 Tax=Janthinobacterium sp. TaxID=1871054 RepID=UPI00293D6532|nr:DNA mismatch repair protein MutS [Janthinobacterium sp.]
MFQSPFWRRCRDTLFHYLRVLLPGEAPALDFPFAASDVAQLRRVAGAPQEAGLDGQTWDDMLLAEYSARLARETSIFGQQVLHRRLHEGAADEAAAARVRALLRDEAGLLRLHEAMGCLRQVDSEISAPLFGPAEAAAPWWTARLWLFPLAVLLTLAATLLSPLAWLGVVASWLALMALQMRYYDDARAWGRTLHGVQMLLRAHVLLAAQDGPHTAALREGARRAGRINRQLTPAQWPKMVPLYKEYSEWVLLHNIQHYFDSRVAARREIEHLRASFLLVAELEADVALARHLLATPRFCWATRCAPGALALEQFVHPLLEEAAPLSVELEGKGAFISGQNGIGKSTLLRGVGLNLIAARAFGFCYAARAAAPMLPVHSSMQSEDSLDGGESLYLAELRRAKELLALADGPRPAVFIIDEIFRGTNHLESISAAAAVLHTLAAKGMVIVSSHNLVLAPLLEDCLAPLCVHAPDGDAARLLLRPGVLAAPNGIALLAARGFGAPIEAKANKVFDWLSAHMAQPRACAHVLGGAAGI